MIFYVIITVITIIAASAYVTRDGDYDPDDIMMSLAAGLFWPVSIPIITGVVIGSYLRS